MFREQVVKPLLRALARNLGYEIRKAPLPGYDAAPVFDLAVHYLMLRRGASLRFVQVGANDGTGAGDPLHPYVARYRWAGIMVEPQPEVFAQLQSNYAGIADRLLFENAAISSREGTISLYRGKGTFDGTQGLDSKVASLNREVVARQLRMRTADMEEVRVPTLGLDALLRKHGWTGFDLLQIDTEGHDWEVLQTLDLGKTRPALIQFEHGHLSPRKLDEMVKHLNAHGYQVHFGGHQSDSLATIGGFLDEDAIGPSAEAG